MSEAEATVIDAGNGEIGLERDARDFVLRALLVGLSAFGELERLRNAWEVRRMCNEDLPDDLQPIDVSGDAGEISNFADAIQAIAHY